MRDSELRAGLIQVPVHKAPNAPKPMMFIIPNLTNGNVYICLYMFIYVYHPQYEDAERSGRLQLFHSRKACVSPHKKGFSSPRPLTHSERLKTATGFVQGGVPYTNPHAPQLVLNKACISTSRL